MRQRDIAAKKTEGSKMTMTNRKPRRDEYEIIIDDERVMLTSSRSRATQKVAELIDGGRCASDIYATYGGDNYKQARAHLLLPDQQ